ncbi:MAG: hypothetical protein JWL95_2326 [Gemmatimonadetes bacterium]|nr:hypothetical protein [Gemmatimonadota bacterium]
MRTLVKSLRLTIAVGALLLGGRAPRADAQITAGITSMVDILTAPLSGVGTRALQFGMIVPGTTSVTVQPRSRSGGEFRITGVRNRKSIDISFTLPTALAGPAGATIPLNFNGNYAGLCEIDASGNCDLASYFTWNPVITPSYRDTPTRYKPGRKVYSYDDYQVYLGGVASPSVTQRQGNYTASIGVLLVVN